MSKKRISKPRTISQRVGDAAVEVARLLAASGHYGTYDAIRHATIATFAFAFARAYGMFPSATFVGSQLRLDVDAHCRVLDILDGLELGATDPHHFGHVHENLAGWTLDGRELRRSSERRGGGVHFTPRDLAGQIVAKTLWPLLAIVPPEQTLELRVCDPSVGAGVFLLELADQLGRRLVEHRIERDLLVAKRLVAVHCGYGVDICRWAVASAKISMWLECRATSMPFDWLDDNIKVGDALVGLDEKQIKAFHWRKDKPRALGLDGIRATFDLAMTLGVAARKTRIADLASAARVSS